MTRPRPLEVLRWDLARSHRVEAVGWTEATADLQFWTTPLDLTLDLPGGRTVRAVLADAHAQRAGQALHVLVLRGLPQALDQAAAEAARRLDELGLPRRDFDRWCEDAASGDFRRHRSFASRRNDLTPTLALELRPTSDDARPWYLCWEISWPASAASPRAN
jgi:hypothetical protein